MKKLLNQWPRSIAAAVLAGIAAIISIAFIKKPVKDIAPFISKNKVSPPFANADIKFKNYSINAQRGLKIKYFETGSVITIPDSAFVDTNGKIIKGKVDIKYREFHDPADFFVSGIPMTYDSAGEKYHFESAGMLEMLAFQNGNPVFLNPEKRIVIEMLSLQTDDKFNIYKYSPLQGNWKYIQKDKAIPLDQPAGSNNALLTANMDNSTKTNEPLIAPVKSDASKYHFDIEIDSAEFPELSYYKGILFEVDKKEKNFDPLYASTTWNDIVLEKGRRRGSYLMTLIKGTESHRFEAQPVLEGSNYERAVVAYKNQRMIRKKKEQEIQRLNDSAYNALKRKMDEDNERIKNTRENAISRIETKDIVLRTFSINGFGIWNSDCPSAFPKGEQFAGIYKDTLGNSLKLNTVYLVEKGRNAMFTMMADQEISFNPQKDNCMWAVTDDNRLAVIGIQEFKKMEIKNGSSIVSMTVFNTPIRNSNQVKALLKI
ncbi:MAG: hypothetical protein WAQ28_12425 [Bacteroidia bacterium]